MKLKTFVGYRLRRLLGFEAELEELKHYRWRAETDAREVSASLKDIGAISIGENERRVALLARLIGTSAGEGLYVCDGLAKTAEISGDVCEFGVAQGATSALIANEISCSGKNLWLYDSFEGLPEPTPKDILIDDIFDLGSMDKYKGTMRCSEDEVVRRLKELDFPSDRYHIVKGFFVNSPSARGPASISFAYIDFDLYQPIVDALEYVDSRMPRGGRIVVDDYGWFSQGAQTAVDEFVATRMQHWKFALPHPFSGKFALLEKFA